MHHCCEINNNSVSPLLPTRNPSQCWDLFFNSLPASLGHLRGYRKLSAMILALGSGSHTRVGPFGLCMWIELSKFSNNQTQAYFSPISSLMLASYAVWRQQDERKRIFLLAKQKCTACKTDTILSKPLRRQ